MKKEKEEENSRLERRGKKGFSKQDTDKALQMVQYSYQVLSMLCKNKKAT
jgi:hypothetical protein